MNDLAYLSTDEMAAKTGKSRDFWARLCNSGALSGVKLGNDWRVAEDEFENFMRAGKKVPGRKRLSARQQRRTA